MMTTSDLRTRRSICTYRLRAAASAAAAGSVAGGDGGEGGGSVKTKKMIKEVEGGDPEGGGKIKDGAVVYKGECTCGCASTGSELLMLGFLIEDMCRY